MRLVIQTILHKVGKGPHHAEDLTREEADEAFGLLVDGRLTPLQTGGLLIALRTKGETGIEIASLVRALRRGARPAEPADVDIPCYAGKAKTFRALPAALLLLRRAGVRAHAHTYDDAPNRQGMGLLLRELGVPYDAVEESHPRLHQLLELRKELGVRSIVNVAARLLDPARVGRHLISISHQPYFEKLRQAVGDLGERALIVMGSEGEPEAPYHGVTRALRTDAGYETHRPEDYGLRRPRLEEVGASSVETEAELSRRVLDGQDLPHRTIVLMTAASAHSVATGRPFRESLAAVAATCPASATSPR